MGSPDLFRALTRSLRGGKARAVAPDDIRLTPYLSVVIAILYMMAADGDISDRESSQLQSVIGADAETLHRAIAYAETRSVDQFLQDVPPVLDTKARLCLLMNVCDSLMADGELSFTELQLFDRLVAALGYTRAGFQPYFDAIALKDRTSVLGDFDAAANAAELTPPKVLVVSLLYMMSADGSMGEEEIGRLNAVVGASQALLKSSLRYVGQVRAPQFLAAAAGVLDQQQRLCVLLNACDTMMSDHQVAGGERDLFRRMLAAFGIAPGNFDSYLNVIYLKNDLPQDERRAPAAGEQAAQAQGRHRHSRRSEGVVFERKRQWDEEGGDAGVAGSGERRKARDAKAQEEPASALDARISRTMQENIDRMSDEFDGNAAFDTVAANSRGGALAGDPGAANDGPTDLRAFRESEFSKNKDQVAEHSHGGKGRHWNDADGAGDQRAMRDANRPTDDAARRDSGTSVPGHHWKDAEGGADRRAMRDGEGPAEAGGGQSQGERKPDRHWKDADGDRDLRATQDAAATTGGTGAAGRGGVFDKPAWIDADGAAIHAGLEDEGSVMPGRAWHDAAMPGEGKAMQDAGAASAGTRLVDDRNSFDGQASDGGAGPALSGPIAGRMDSVSDRTKTIQAHLEAMRSARSITAANRLPRLPAGPAVQRRLPAAAVAAQVSCGAGAALAMGAGDAASVGRMDVEEASPMLLASDEGGPLLSENTSPPSPEQARLNRRLRQWSAVLLPALFVTYGTTMVGETAAERTFITSENMATDARVVHQMASVQQTVYRVVPEAVALASASPGSSVPPGASASPADGEAVMPSDREQADSFLERRKQELQALFKRHQGASAVAAERQQWFVYAKSIVLPGLGMAFWGVLFRSMRMLHGSTAAGLLGLLLTANGYWLFMHF